MGSLYAIISHYVDMLCNLTGKCFSRSRDNNSPLLDDSPLCETCSKLELDRFFRESLLERDPPLILGALTTILSNSDKCGLCHLISLVFSCCWRLDLHPDEDLTSVQVQLRVSPCGWAASGQYLPFQRRPLCAHRIELVATRTMAITQMQKKLRMSHMLELQMMEDDAERFGRERAFHGRRVEAEFSIKRIKEWLRICEKEHGPSCADVWKDVVEQLPQDMKMIDVVHMAVVDAPSNCRYIALSYVWGNISLEYQTLAKNVAERRKRGSLKNVELPRTISDAIKLVQKLEERYLWVDALCIIQDDIIHKRIQIAGMHTIYGAAAVTIFAASGDSAQAPLPGLEPGSRQKLQHIRKIQSLHLAVPLKMLRETLTTLKWNLRGWTFQEHMLSRRRLFFTNEQLYFECEREEFSEDVIAESCMKSGWYPAKFSRASIHFERPKYWMELYETYVNVFMQVIDVYSIRQLSNDDDIYNAVFALISVFSRGFEESPLDPHEAFLFGMPMSMLEDAMLWQPAPDAPAHERRFVNGLVTPSWSWAGWIGGVVYDDIDSESIYYPSKPRSYQSQKGSLVDEWIIGDLDGQARQISTVRPLERMTYFNVPVKYLGFPTPLGSLLVHEGDSLAPGTLLFYTTAAFLRVQKMSNRIDKNTMVEPIRVYGSKFHSIFAILSNTSPPAMMGRIVLPSNIDTSKPLEFVVLSRSLVSHQSLFDPHVFGKSYIGCLLNVMVVRQVGRSISGMDVSERFGVGMIVEAAWIAIGFKEKVVCLQ